MSRLCLECVSVCLCLSCVSVSACVSVLRSAIVLAVKKALMFSVAFFHWCVFPVVRSSFEDF